MIRSMTAYARREIKGEWGSATWEMRSVNQRYLETYFRLPEQFRSLEPVVRERIRSRLTRGKVECTLRYEPDVSAQGELILNEKLAKQLGVKPKQCAMIGDQILTDVLAGNLAGMHTVLLQPIDTSAEFKGTKINRKLEKVIKKLWKIV